MRSDLTFSLTALLAALASNDFLAINDQAEIVNANLQALDHAQPSSPPDPLRLAAHQLLVALALSSPGQIASAIVSLNLLLPPS